MLDRHQPPLSLSRRLHAATAPAPAPPAPPAPLPPPDGALQGLQALLDLARASGPSPLHLTDASAADVQQLLVAAAAIAAANPSASPNVGAPALLMQQSSGAAGGPLAGAVSGPSAAWASGPSVVAAAAGAAGSAAAGSGEAAAAAVGGHVGVLKRLRYVHQCARELITVPSSPAAPQPVRRLAWPSHATPRPLPWPPCRLLATCVLCPVAA